MLMQRPFIPVCCLVLIVKGMILDERRTDCVTQDVRLSFPFILYCAKGNEGECQICLYVVLKTTYQSFYIDMLFVL